MADDALAAIAERLQGICLGRGLTVATAESCTGGLLSDALTDIPGSSAYFLGGVVSYSNEAKVAALGVDASALEAHGAVSAQVARSMADGARARFGSDLAVAVTGVAGPDGGSDAKPVGLTYVAVADADGIEVRRFIWQGNRRENKGSSAMAALELLVERASADVSASSAETEAAEPVRSR